jgi:hypothetical protein
MNKKQLTLVVVLGLILGGAGLYRYLQNQAPTPETRMGKKLLGTNFEINAVCALRLQNSSNALNVAITSNLWTVKERGDYPANFTTVADFLGKLAELKIVKPVDGSLLARLELTPPPDKKGPGVLVELKDNAGKPLKTLLLGAKHMKEGRGGGPMGDTGWPDGRYVMVDNKPDSLALVSDALSQAEPKPEDWISKDFFKVEKLKAVSVTTTNATNNWKLVRDTDGGEWKLADAKGDEKADSSKCSGLNYLLQTPSFDDLALGWKFEGTNQPTTTATLETFDGFTYAVQLANKTGDNYYFHVAVTADLPKSRTPGKDEKPEDKDKLDKEFKEKNEKLQEKLKTEKTYGKWNYVVSKWTVDNLLKDRKEFVAERKVETNMPPLVVPGITNVPAATNPPTALTNPLPAGTNLSVPVPPKTNAPVVLPPKTNVPPVVIPPNTNAAPPAPPKTNAAPVVPPGKATNTAAPPPPGK